MRYLALLFLLPSLCFAGDWTIGDTVRQSTVTTLLIADWAQTRTTARNPNKFAETNDVLGEHPSIGKVNNYFAGSIIGHAVISYMLPRSWREGWQYVWIGSEMHSVIHNYRLGVKFTF